MRAFRLALDSPRKQELLLQIGRFYALAFGLLDGSGILEVNVVGQTPEASVSPEDFEVRCVELDTVHRVEGPRHIPVKQCLNHRGIQ